MTVKISVQGILTAKVFLDRKEKSIQLQTTAGLNKAALHLQNEVKSSIAGQRTEPTSVDTGRFLNSVDIQVGKNDAKIFSAIPYSKYLEYGTSRIGARKHFRNSKDREKGKVKRILQGKISKI